MVTTYELISKISKKEDFKLMLKAGIVPIQFLDWKIIYEFYCNQKSRGIRHSEAICFTAEEFGTSENWIWKIKYKMESVVK